MDGNFILESMADCVHEVWAKWMKSVLDRCRNENGDLAIPYELAARWDRQIKTGYEDLSEEEKESDRKVSEVIMERQQEILNIALLEGMFDIDLEKLNKELNNGRLK